jgi:hypothetical protein
MIYDACLLPPFSPYRTYKVVVSGSEKQLFCLGPYFLTIKQSKLENSKQTTSIEEWKLVL